MFLEDDFLFVQQAYRYVLLLKVLVRDSFNLISLNPPNPPPLIFLLNFLLFYEIFSFFVFGGVEEPSVWMVLPKKEKHSS